MVEEVELTILMPCLNEARTLPTCINKAISFLEKNKIQGEILLSDNGSVDNSRQIAESLGVRVINAQPQGYGAALSAGIKAANGRFIIMADSDDSYDFLSIFPFLEHLRAGAEIVIGDRFAGESQPGAMPFLHRYLGVPILSLMGRLTSGLLVSDFHCGLRSGRKDVLIELDLKTTGMEFASEMLVKAGLQKRRVVEVPIIYYPDGRGSASHLRTWRDGFRHLSLLMYYLVFKKFKDIS